jgi:ribonuclease HI
MRQKKQKYYVVWQGHHPGIYSSWEACKAQVDNFPDARYKSYESKAEADAAYSSGPERRGRLMSLKTNYARSEELSGKYSVMQSQRQSSAMEYRGVWTAESEIFHYGPAKDGTNNIGEFLALVHALALLQKKNDPATPIYSDSKTAIAWVKKKKANTQLKLTKHNAELFDMIRRAEKWLKENTWKNPIHKWETEHWGEIPADFGRK